MFRIERSENGDIGSVRRNLAFLPGGESLEYLTFPLLEETGTVRHLFTTRLGGVSRGPFSTMNLSFTRGDSAGAVEENYRRIAWVLGCESRDMTASHQTHTTNIRRVTASDRGKGVTRPRDYENVDGLVTDEAGIVLVTYFADCVPLYFVDPVRRAVGLAHSGWRGTAEGMGARMVSAMEREFSSKREDILAVVGPSICRDCYEVDGEAAERFSRLFGGAALGPGRRPEKRQLDLWLANRLILEQAGIRPEHIAVTDLCTRHNSGYLFSHRSSGEKRGNLGAFLMLKSI